MEVLCPTLWRPLAAPLTSLAILSRVTPQSLIDRLMDWSFMRSDEYTVRRKFGSSFGGMRDKEAPLTFAEMKRTAVQVISLNTLAVCLGVFGRLEGMEERRMIMRIASYAGDVIGEVHGLGLRRGAYIDPLKDLFEKIGKCSFEVLLEYLNLTIGEASKSSRFELYVRTFSRVPLTIYPSEELEHSLFFVETLASYYADVKGFEMREAFSSALSSMLLPLVESVSAEVNLPKWEKIFAKILLKRVFGLCEKQKYRQVTLDLTVIEGSLSPSHTLPILQLVWVYCNRYPEAFATQSSKISRIIDVFTPNIRRVAVPADALTFLFAGLAIILGPSQPQSFLRDTLLPLFEGLDSTNIEGFPVLRVTVGIMTLLYFGSLQVGDLTFPTRELLENTSGEDVQRLCESYVNFKPDFITKEVLERVRHAVGKAFSTLDTLLWDSNLYDFKSMNHHRSQVHFTESSANTCLKLILETSPFIEPLFSNETQLLELLLKYSAHTDDSFASKSIKVFEKQLSILMPDNEVIVKLYWLYAAQYDKVPDRCSQVLENLARLFPKMARLALLYIADNEIDQKGILPILADISVKSFMMIISSSGSIRERGLEVFLQIEDCIQREYESSQDEMIKELVELVKITKRHFQGEYLVSFETISNFLHDTLNSCPTVAGLSKISLMTRLQEIQTLLSGKSQYIEDELVIQWSYYLASLFCFGAPEANTSTLNKRIDGISLRRLLSFSKSESNISTIKGFLRFSLQNLTNDNYLVCESLCDASFALNPLFLGEFFKVLEPCITAVSEDYRNVRYQVTRKNKRQDTLKVDLTRLINRVVPKISQCQNGNDPQASFHQIIKRYIIEVFYFVSEIDTEQHLPGLRYGLAELVRNYHHAVHCMHPRYEFFPFKLQTELFLAFRGWFEERRIGNITLATGATASNESALCNFESASSLHSGSVLTMRVAAQDVERTYAECLVSLCHGLLSPLPIYRNESIPSSQVLRWVDSLISCEPWGSALVRLAVRNILTSNRSILEKVIQKIFQADVVMQYPLLSDAYFLAVCEALLEGKVDLPTHSIVALLAFKMIQGSLEAKKMAENVAGIWLKTEVEDDGANLIDSLPNNLCMLSGQVVSELVLRVEYLLTGQLEGAVKNLLCSWLGKIAFIPGQQTLTTLQNIALITLRYHQRESLSDSFELWDSLLLWKHHFTTIVEFWADLILRFRNVQLVDVSSDLIRHLCAKRENLPLVVDAIVALIEPKKCLMIEQKSPKILITTNKQDDGDFFASSRMDAILQTLEKNSIPSDFTVGHIVVKWISNLYQNGLTSIVQHPEVQHLWMVLTRNEYPPIMSWINAVKPNDLPPLEDDTSALVALQWAVRCPIKIHALCSWEILTWRMHKLAPDEVRRLAPIIAAYISMICGIPTRTKSDSPRVKTSCLISQSLTCLRSVSSQVLEDSTLRRDLCRIAMTMIDTDELVIFSEALYILLRTMNDISLIDTNFLCKIIRGYTNIVTFPTTVEFSCSMLGLLFRSGSRNFSNLAAQLLICMLPAMLNTPSKMAIEAASMACNILDGHDRARVAIRILQSFGKKKYRGSPDAARDLALIFADDLFTDYSALVILTTSASIKSGKKDIFEATCHFITQWIKLATGKLPLGPQSPLWEPLAESLVEASSNGPNQFVISAIDSIFTASKTFLLSTNLQDTVKALGLNTDLGGMSLPMQVLAKELLNSGVKDPFEVYGDPVGKGVDPVVKGVNPAVAVESNSSANLRIP